MAGALRPPAPRRARTFHYLSSGHLAAPTKPICRASCGRPASRAGRSCCRELDAQEGRAALGGSTTIIGTQAPGPDKRSRGNGRAGPTDSSIGELRASHDPRGSNGRRPPREREGRVPLPGQVPERILIHDVTGEPRDGQARATVGQPSPTCPLDGTKEASAGRCSRTPPSSATLRRAAGHRPRPRVAVPSVSAADALRRVALSADCRGPARPAARKPELP
jgi:hypothetical protein